MVTEFATSSPPKAGIGEILKFGLPFLVDMDRENNL
jgi:hypothetical protein